MRRLVFICLFIAFIFSHQQLLAQRSGNVTLPNTEVRYLDSESVSEMTYKIEVILPPGYDMDTGRSYPVLYFLDAFMATGLMNDASFMLSTTQLIEPVIMVGINFDGTTDDFFRIRTRDYTPMPISSDSSEGGTGVSALSGGGPEFLNFIRDELIPFVQEHYRVDREGRGILGYSMGGLFATWMLVEDPALFDRYGIGSPSLHLNNYEVLNQLENQIIDSAKTVFISKTETELPGIEPSFDRLDAFLRNSSLDVISTQIADENHHSGLPATYMRAVRQLYEPE